MNLIETLELETSELIEVGRVTAAFGIKGWVKIRSYTDPVDNILQYRPWWLCPASRSPIDSGRYRANSKENEHKIEIEDHRWQNQQLVVLFKGFNDRNQAEALKQLSIWVSRDQLPELEADEYYWHQLIGLHVYNEQSTYLGRVVELFETGANDVMVLTPPHAEYQSTKNQSAENQSTENQSAQRQSAEQQTTVQPITEQPTGQYESINHRLERLIPYTEQVVQRVDLDEQLMIVRWELDY